MAVIKHYIIVGNRKYDYTLNPSREETLLACPGADIEERYPNEEIPKVLANLPKIIIHIQRNAPAQSEVLRFRVTPEEKLLIAERALEEGFDNISAYLRHVALSDKDEGG